MFIFYTNLIPWQPVVSAVQMEHLWDREDQSHTGHLDAAGVNAVLLRLGNWCTH
jgi:hypothetical protein